MKKEAALVLLLVLLGCSPLAGVDVPLQTLKEDLKSVELPNGMKVTTKEMHSLPLVTIQFWVRVGARNEPDQYRGIAHIFEHIWFKGTATQPVGSFHKKVESLGGELNAMTSHDWTMYYVVVPSDKFDDIFPLMVDLLLNSGFNQTEITKELQVIVEEQRFSFNEPERFLDDQFGLLLIDEHPYRNPVIGYKDTILGATRDAIMDFYHTWYVPNNMNIVVVGDIESDEIIRKVSEAFLEFEPKKLPELTLPTQQPILTPKYNSTTKDVGYTYLALGYLAPNAQDKDRYAMHVLNTIFSQSESSRLQSKIKKQDNLIVRGTSVFAPLKDMGVFETVLVVEPEKKGEALTQTLLELGKFRTELVTEEELSRAKKLILAERVKSQEEMFQVGFNIGESWIDGDVHDYTTFIENINKVSAEDVRNAAQKHFIAYTLYEVQPKV